LTASPRLAPLPIPCRHSAALAIAARDAVSAADIHFVSVKDWLLLRAGAAQTQQLIEHAALATVRPRTEHERLRISTTGANAL
jgi:hypothetical protein